jgi:hypothetical protein
LNCLHPFWVELLAMGFHYQGIEESFNYYKCSFFTFRLSYILQFDSFQYGVCFNTVFSSNFALKSVSFSVDYVLF